VSLNFLFFLFQQAVGFTDQLHVAILDAVVNHFNIVPGPTGAHPLTAGNIVVGTDPGGNGLENGLYGGPGVTAPAGHNAGSVPCAFLSAGNSAAEVKNAARIKFFDILLPAFILKIISLRIDLKFLIRNSNSIILTSY
jgi:hypothetical protein